MRTPFTVESPRVPLFVQSPELPQQATAQEQVAVAVGAGAGAVGTLAVGADTGAVAEGQPEQAIPLNVQVRTPFTVESPRVPLFVQSPELPQQATAQEQVAVAVGVGTGAVGVDTVGADTGDDTAPKIRMLSTVNFIYSATVFLKTREFLS